LLLAVKCTAGYEDGMDWKLAFNINPADGHSFGYGVKAWEDDSNVGTDENAFSADYKNYNATLETANFIAIVRHQNGTCEAARVWKFLKSGKTLRDYLDISQTSRYIATQDPHSYSYISPTLKNKDKDPIFSVEGALVFNWWHADNGVRIGNSKTHCSSELPGESANTDKFFGIGNDIAGDTRNGGGGVHGFDIGIQDCRAATANRAQGTDHGDSYKDGPVLGQYAIIVSDKEGKFSCDGVELRDSLLQHKTMVYFNHIDRGDDKLLNWEEYVFDITDSNNNGELSLEEYSIARKKYFLGDTRVGLVKSDFNRIDKNGDGALIFSETVFDSADTNDDGLISLMEYLEACVHKKFGETGTVADVVNDFHRIDKSGDEKLAYLEMIFDEADADKDGEFSKREFSKAHDDGRIDVGERSE